MYPSNRRKQSALPAYCWWINICCIFMISMMYVDMALSSINSHMIVQVQHLPILSPVKTRDIDISLIDSKWWWPSSARVLLSDTFFGGKSVIAPLFASFPSSISSRSFSWSLRSRQWERLIEVIQTSPGSTLPLSSFRMVVD